MALHKHHTRKRKSGDSKMRQSKMNGPKTELAQRLHADKYRTAGETFEEGMSRVAWALSDDEAHRVALFDAILHQRFLPAGRIQAAVGQTRNVTPYNCFVSGTIEDSFVDGHGSIMAIATEAAATMRMGGGIGYDFSTLRPRKALIKKLGSHSSGPVSFMHIYNAICLATCSAGHRRGAQMGIMRIDHPDIEEFIHAKKNETDLTGFNISIAVTDEFMEHLADGRPFPLRFGGEVYREVDPKSLWDQVMQIAFDWGEPGVIFIDRINEMNNLAYCEKIAATNPCGEQPLPPYGACLLGSFNLTKYLVEGDDLRPTMFNYDAFCRDIPIVVRALDNVIDVATYPLFEQEKEAKAKRRMGLGVTGVANTIEAMGYPYGSPTFCNVLDRILATLKVTAYAASVELAKEKGAFPAFESVSFCKSKFVHTLPDKLRADIKEHGIRNSHLISIAPTGTISITADNVSSGIEPVFSYRQGRRVNTPSGLVVVEADDYGSAVLGVRGTPCADVTIDEHLAVAETSVKHVDSAVSKTINCPKETTWETFVDIYRRAWASGCKGITVYRNGCKREGILFEIEEVGEEPKSCTIDPRTGARDCE